MGADMIIVVIPMVPFDDDLEEKERITTANKVIDVLQKEDLGEFWYEFNGEDENNTLEEMREGAKAVIKEVFNAFNHRTVTWVSLFGVRVYMTGGMSYGDAPSDECTLFDQFNELPEEVHQACKAWPKRPEWNEVFK